MTIDVFRQIYFAMQQTSDEELLNDVRKKAVRYAGMRAEWALASTDQRMEIDSARTRAHDAFIASINILSRFMATRENLSVEWRSELGTDRKIIGDLACAVFYLLGCPQNIQKLYPISECENVYRALVKGCDEAAMKGLKSAVIQCTKAYASEVCLPVDVSSKQPARFGDFLQNVRELIQNTEVLGEIREKVQDDSTLLALACGLNYLLCISAR